MRPVRAVRVFTDIIKEKFAEPIERDALHEARGNDAVGVDIVTGNVYAAASDLSDIFESHVRKI